jgi:hypothetical protein
MTPLLYILLLGWLNNAKLNLISVTELGLVTFIYPIIHANLSHQTVAFHFQNLRDINQRVIH